MIKPITNLVNKYSDDILGFGVRKLVKPSSVNGLKLTSSMPIDLFSSSLKKSGEMFVPADTKLFSWVKRKNGLCLTKIEPESLVMVHRTNYFPTVGKILTTSDVTKKITGVAEYRPTIHFALNKSVTEHLVGAEWNTMKYSIILPFKECVESVPKAKVIGGIQDDFFLMDSVKLPRGSVILKHSSKIPKDQLLVSEIFDGIRFVESSSDDMVKTTDLVIKKMGFTPYNEALQKYLGASAEEMNLLTSIPEVQISEAIKNIAGDFEKNRTQILANIKTLEEFKDLLSPQDFAANLEIYIKNLKMCNIAEKYSEKINTSGLWEKFFSSKGYYSGLHKETPWAKSEIAFIGLKTLAKGNKNSWIWCGTDYRIRLLSIFEECKEKISKDKDLGYDIDKVISIIKNSPTPELAENEIMKQLRIKAMRAPDRTSQLKKGGFTLNDISNIQQQIEQPSEFQLSLFLDLFCGN